MANTLSTLEACRTDLFTSEADLREKYPVAFADRLLRIREVYNYWLANPSTPDRQLRDVIMQNYGVSQSAAYSDIHLLHQIVPLFSQKSRDFHRARYFEMILDTFNKAKEEGDLRTMERAATSYAKYAQIENEDEKELPYEDIAIQPFVASTDPTLLGVKPIPDIYNHIAKLVKEFSRDNRDIEDVEAEIVDLEEDQLFAPLENGTGQSES